MNDEKKIQINLAIPERYRNLLRRMAAERMMANPEQNGKRNIHRNGNIVNGIERGSRRKYKRRRKRNDHIGNSSIILREGSCGDPFE